MNAKLPTIKEFFRALSIGHVERRLMGLSLAVGVVVWPVVYALKELVHWLFHEVVVWIEHADTPFLLFIPLLIGAALVLFTVVAAHFLTDDSIGGFEKFLISMFYLGWAALFVSVTVPSTVRAPPPSSTDRVPVESLAIVTRRAVASRPPPTTAP